MNNKKLDKLTDMWSEMKIKGDSYEDDDEGDRKQDTESRRS
jgi:hypothetical protein